MVVVLMETQLRAMSLSTSSAELCMDEGLSADSSEEVVWWPGFWGKVLAMGNEAAGVIN